MKSLQLMCFVCFVAVLFVAGQALGEVIYSDSFSGSASDNLKSKVTDVGGGVWNANNTATHVWKQDGSITGTTNGSDTGRHSNALLPFAPEAGYVYTAQATINNVDTLYYAAPMWVGFAPTSAYFGPNDWCFANPDTFAARDYGTAHVQGMAGGATQLFHGGVAAPATIAVTLDTTGSLWTSSFYVNGVAQILDYTGAPGGTVYTYPAGFFDTPWLAIGQVGFGRSEWSAGTVDNFSLTQEQVPEPSTLVLVGTGLLGLLAYAWRKRK
jgi:hypothetical protein